MFFNELFGIIWNFVLFFVCSLISVKWLKSRLGVVVVQLVLHCVIMPSVCCTSYKIISDGALEQFRQ
jgi:hypothetical protein